MSHRTDTLKSTVHAEAEGLMGMPDPHRRWTPLSQASERTWESQTYTVAVLDSDDGLRVLRIRARDDQQINDWRHLQAIKNTVCGPASEAIEVYPVLDGCPPVDPRDRALYVAPAAPHTPSASTQDDDLVLTWLPLIPPQVPVFESLAPDDTAPGFPPVHRVPVNPDLYKALAAGSPLGARAMRAYANGAANGYTVPAGGDPEHPEYAAYLTWKFDDRRATHDPTAQTAFAWTITRTISPRGGWAFELFPAEGPSGRLIDAANQWHLYVQACVVDDLPARSASGVPVIPVPYSRSTGRWALGRDEQDVATEAEGVALHGTGMGRQRAWEKGLPTGPTLLND